jgi:hypothetical protein
MSITLGLIALSLLGAEGPPNRDAPEIAYNVRVLNMNGLEWRGALFSQLRPVACRGGSTVWTTSRETAQKLADRDPKGLTAPRVTTASQSVAHLFQRTNRKVSSGLNRLADGPFDHATQVAYTPSYEQVREGWAITLTGRKIDQGVLVCAVLEDTRIAAVHQVALTENVVAKDCCEGEDACAAGCKKLACRIEVPEVAQAAAAGEWLIPNDGALVVSLGVQTTADEQGKAVVVERVVLIEARAVGDGEVRQASLATPAPFVVPDRGGAADSPPAAPAPAPAEPAGVPLPMAMPAMPSRSLPQACAVDGSTMSLPPLPENPATPSSLPGSSEPCASPQSPNRRNEPSTLDTASTTAGFTPAPREKEKVAESAANDPPRPCLLRIPLKARGLDVEVEVRAVLPFLKPGRSGSSAQAK